jgi:hypothetical protein
MTAERIYCCFTHPGSFDGFFGRQDKVKGAAAALCGPNGDIYSDAVRIFAVLQFNNSDYNKAAFERRIRGQFAVSPRAPVSKPSNSFIPNAVLDFTETSAQAKGF